MRTPGPWIAISDIVVTECSKQTICDCRTVWTQAGDPNIEVPISKANAKLIAAAPDLLDACKSAIRRLDSILDDAVDGKPSENYKQILKAIKKAEG